MKTPPLSDDDPIDEMQWSIGENMYSFSTMDQIKDTLSIDYSYSYKLKNNFVPLDTILNPVLDDVVVVIDPAEYAEEIRAYDVFDTFDANGQEEPILINREHEQ